ncbi:MAG: HAD hydrolase-like protein [Candidatus Pacebacteria bacterium]|nr:HAD hydrolase-like protein [Candidatus Paceibacterota bacterium]
MRIINKVLCFDYDETTVPTSPSLFKFMNDKLGTDVQSGHHDDFVELFGITVEKMFQLFDEFAEKDIMKNVKPYKGMYELFLELKKLGFRIVVTTARPRPTYYKQTRTHMDRFFPGIFGPKDLIMHEYPDETIHKVNKTEMVASVSGGMFIDDSPSKVEEVKNNIPDILVLFKEDKENPIFDINELSEDIIPVKDANDIKKEIFKFFNITEKDKTYDAEARTFTD